MIITLLTCCLKFELLETFGIKNENYWTDIWSRCPAWIRVNISSASSLYGIIVLVECVFPSYAVALLCFYERDAQGLVLRGPSPSLLLNLLPFTASSTWGSFSFVLVNHGGGCLRYWCSVIRGDFLPRVTGPFEPGPTLPSTSPRSFQLYRKPGWWAKDEQLAKKGPADLGVNKFISLKVWNPLWSISSTSKLQKMHVSVNEFLSKACWTWGVESLTTAVGFLWQFACEPGHGQGCLRVDDHERRAHSRHRGPDQHHPGGAGAPGVPADRQDRCRSAHAHLEASGRGWGDPGLPVPTRVYGCVCTCVRVLSSQWSPDWLRNWPPASLPILT